MTRIQYIILAFILICHFAYCQISEIRFSEKRNGEKVTWSFVGKADFSYGTILAFRLVFYGTELPYSRSWKWVQDGKFIYQYGPFNSKAVSGNYTLVIDYRHSLQSEKFKAKRMIKDQSWKKKYFVGQLSKQSLEKVQVRKFLLNNVRKMEKFVEELERKSKFFIENKKKSKVSSVVKWVNQTPLRLYKVEQELAKYKYPNVLANYSPKSIDDLSKILIVVRKLWEMHAWKLVSEYSIPMPKNIQVTKWKQKNVDQCQKLCASRFIALKKRERFFSYLNEQDLQQDLLLASKVFQEIIKTHDAMEKRLLRDIWQQSFVNWEIQLNSLTDRVTDYQKSSLAKKHKEGIALLQKFTALTQKLMFAYTKKLYEQAQLPINSKIAAIKLSDIKIRSRLDGWLIKINRIIKSIKRISSQEKRRNSKNLEQIFISLQKLYEQVKKKESIDANNWQKLEKRIGLLRKTQPGAYLHFRGVLYSLKVVVKIHSKKKKLTSKNKLQLKRYQLNIKSLMQQLHKEIYKKNQ